MRRNRISYTKLLCDTPITEEMNLPYHKAFMKFTENITDYRDLQTYRFWLRLMVSLYNKYNEKESFEMFVDKHYLFEELREKLAKLKIDIM